MISVLALTLAAFDAVFLAFVTREHLRLYRRVQELRAKADVLDGVISALVKSPPKPKEPTKPPSIAQIHGMLRGK